MVISAGDRKLETVLRRRVDIQAVPVLADHVIDGHSVLPMALILEWAAEGAVQRNPGLAVRGVDNLRLFKGLILGDRETANLEIAAGKAVRVGEEFRVSVELRGTPAGGREVLHARADVLLAARARDRPASARRSRRCRTRHPHPMSSMAACCSTARRCRGSSGSKGAASAGSRAGSAPLRRPPNGSSVRSGRDG